MQKKNVLALFALLSSAVREEPLEDSDKKRFFGEGSEKIEIPSLVALAKRHDVAPMLAVSLIENKLVGEDSRGASAEIAAAVYRFEQLKLELECVSSIFEKEKIPHIPLKGAVLRNYYKKPYLRTSCDLDILVRKEDFERACDTLLSSGYSIKSRSAHDVTLIGDLEQNLELHFDLVEEGRANNSTEILSTVWDSVTRKSDSRYCYDMSDAFFYLYHVAHMAKHFEEGGCGVRPVIDLWILDRIDSADALGREELLSRANLLVFANALRKLGRVWLDGEVADELSLKIQDFILRGGTYGATESRVALRKRTRGGKLGYMLSRAFIPYSKLKGYYPILEKHRWLTPFMQVRRWFMIFNPSVAKMAKSELNANANMDNNKANELKQLLKNIGINKK